MNCKANYDTILLGDVKMTIVFKVSEELQKKMIKYYENKKREKTPPYAYFQALDADTIVTLYESGKVMFQGISADIDANMWIDLEKKLTGTVININENKEKQEKAAKIKNEFYRLSTIGSDEVGTGDYFGPIVVTASFVPKDKVDELDKLGVRDSKKITDEKIKQIAPTLLKEVEHVTYILNNKEYNEYQKKGYNMNQIKAILHNKVLYELKEKISQYDKMVVDQFVYPKKYYEHLKEEKQVVYGITFLTKAESVCASVAASSCISRYLFLEEMDKLSDKLKMVIPKGAGEDVDEVAAKVVKQYGEQMLYDVAKLNFKNTFKLQEYIKQ